MTKGDAHRRRSLRLRGYDYSWAGAYFVTVCTHNRACLFGEIVNGEMWLNDVGRMVETHWRSLSKRFPRVQPDVFVVMPNHMHGIIALTDVGAALVAAQGRARMSTPPRWATTRVAPTANNLCPTPSNPTPLTNPPASTIFALHARCFYAKYSFLLMGMLEIRHGQSPIDNTR